jgi:hypothetical protein
VVIFTPGPLYSQANSPCTHWIGGWVGSGAVLDAVVKRKIPSLCLDSIIQPVAQRYITELSWLIYYLLVDVDINTAISLPVLETRFKIYFCGKFSCLM